VTDIGADVRGMLMRCSKKKKRKKVVQEQVAEAPAASSSDVSPAEPESTDASPAEPATTATNKEEPTIQAGTRAMFAWAVQLLGGLRKCPPAATLPNSIRPRRQVWCR
jgi:hypothetical protein